MDQLIRNHALALLILPAWLAGAYLRAALPRSPYRGDFFVLALARVP